MLMRWQVRCFEPWDHDAYLYVQMLKHCLLCRSAFKQVIPFLDYTSQAALLTGTCKLLVTSPVNNASSSCHTCCNGLCSGATVQQLEACEQRLGITLPWQVPMHSISSDVPALDQASAPCEQPSLSLSAVH